MSKKAFWMVSISSVGSCQTGLCHHPCGASVVPQTSTRASVNKRFNKALRFIEPSSAARGSYTVSTCEQQLVLGDSLHRFQKVVFQSQAGTSWTHLRQK